MFVLDTNVLSAIMRSDPAREAASWILGQSSEDLFTAAVCQAEILSGIALLPGGKRRAGLAEAARAMFDEDFKGRVLPFDTEAASAYADLFVARRRAGRAASTADMMIAAVARANGASLVTRNVADFEECGLVIVNPWNT